MDNTQGSGWNGELMDLQRETQALLASVRGTGNMGRTRRGGASWLPRITQFLARGGRGGGRSKRVFISEGYRRRAPRRESVLAASRKKKKKRLLVSPHVVFSPQLTLIC